MLTNKKAGVGMGQGQVKGMAKMGTDLLLCRYISPPRTKDLVESQVEPYLLCGHVCREGVAVRVCTSLKED